MGLNREAVLKWSSIVCFAAAFFILFSALRNVLQGFEPILFGFNVFLALAGLFLLAVADQIHERRKRSL